MNKLNELNEYIENAWQQLKEAADNENWPGTQQAFRKMATLQDLNEQSRNLQQRIAGLSDQGAPAAHPPRDKQAPIPYSQRRPIKRPKQLRIGTHQIPIAINNQIPLETGNWILKQGVALPRLRNFIQPNKSQFERSAQVKQLNDNQWIEIGDSQETLIQKARKLLNLCGFRELELEIQLEDGTSKTA